MLSTTRVLDDPVPRERRTAHDMVVVGPVESDAADRLACVTVSRATDINGPWPIGKLLPRWMTEVLLPLAHHVTANKETANLHPHGGRYDLVSKGAARAARDQEFAEALWGVFLLSPKVGVLVEFLERACP